MVTNDERREVAQKLRELEVGDFPDGRFYDWGEVETALGIVDYGSWYKEADVQRLADLIDRPLVLIGVNKHGRAYCTNCGCDDWCLADGSHFCPNCGAEMLDD